MYICMFIQVQSLWVLDTWTSYDCWPLQYPFVVDHILKYKRFATRFSTDIHPCQRLHPAAVGCSQNVGRENGQPMVNRDRSNRCINTSTTQTILPQICNVLKLHFANFGLLPVVDIVCICTCKSRVEVSQGETSWKQIHDVYRDFHVSNSILGLLDIPIGGISHN